MMGRSVSIGAKQVTELASELRAIYEELQSSYRNLLTPKSPNR